MRKAASFKKEVESKYSIKALNSKQHKKTNTEDSLLHDYLSENPQISSLIATRHIDKVVTEEMSKTISTLNEFVNKVQLSSQITEMNLEKKKH